MSQDIHHVFADAGRAAAPEPLHAFLEVVDALPEFRAYKRRLRPSLALRSGDTVLDVGCGVGFEACRLAQECPGVSVIGLDREAMLAAAAVDACLTERVLKYLPDPAAGIAEMVRVLKPGGRVACFELDYAATLLGGDPAVAGAVGELLNASVGDARLGRRLPALLREAGPREVTFEVVAFSPPWVVHEATVGDPVRAAIGRGELPAAAATAWLEQQAAAAAAGLFTVAFVGFLVGGRLPEA